MAPPDRLAVAVSAVRKACDDYWGDGEIEQVAKAVLAADPATTFLDRLIAMDDPDPQSKGFHDRRSVTLTQIIEAARIARGE